MGMITSPTGAAEWHDSKPAQPLFVMMLLTDMLDLEWRFHLLLWHCAESSDHVALSKLQHGWRRQNGNRRSRWNGTFVVEAELAYDGRREQSVGETGLTG